MDISYFLNNTSQGAIYLGKAVEELEINVTEETTVPELFGIFNGMFARALDMLIEDLKKDEELDVTLAKQ